MFGWSDLKKNIKITAETVECPVNGCTHTVPRQRNAFKAEGQFYCPVHHIYISPSTFEYQDERANMLWGDTDDLALWNCIKTPGVKRESRMARDNSEDSVTWNVFRYLERNGLIREFVNMAAGEQTAQNPRVVYWSFCQTSQCSWLPLLDAAVEFGENVSRRSEPDIIVDDERLLTFIENKWLSSNTTKPTDTLNPKKYLAGGNGWFGQVFKPDTTFKKIAVDDMLYELMRLWLLGSWIAQRDQKRFLLINVVRAESESDIEPRFGLHALTGADRRFKRLTWEDTYSNIIKPQLGHADADRLAHYFQEKTIGYRMDNQGTTAQLGRAFSLPSS